LILPAPLRSGKSAIFFALARGKKKKNKPAQRMQLAWSREQLAFLAHFEHILEWPPGLYHDPFFERRRRSGRTTASMQLLERLLGGAATAGPITYFTYKHEFISLRWQDFV
jgi:hypothetical protein